MFDDPNLVSAAGLVPVLALARAAGLQELAGEHLSVPTDKGANAGGRWPRWLRGGSSARTAWTTWPCCVTAGWAGCSPTRTPSTLGSFLPSFAFGHVRQLDAVASRSLTRLAELTSLVGATGPDAVKEGGPVMVDINDTIIEVHGHTKQVSGYGYSGVRGLNALLATVTTAHTAPGVVAQRLRKGSCGSPRGGKSPTP